MAKKRKKKISLAGPGYEGTREIKRIEVDDPVQPGRKMKAEANVRASGIRLLLDRGRISQPQALAGFKLEAAFFRAALTNVGAVDYSKTKVDGGVLSDPITEAQREARRELSEVANLPMMRPENYFIIYRVCGEGRSITDIADRWGRHLTRMAGKQAEAIVSHELLIGLDIAAKHYGYGTARGAQSHGRILLAHGDFTAGSQEWEIGLAGDLVPVHGKAQTIKYADPDRK